MNLSKQQFDIEVADLIPQGYKLADVILRKENGHRAHLHGVYVKEQPTGSYIFSYHGMHYVAVGSIAEIIYKEGEE